MRFLYTIIISLYNLLIYLVAPFNSKALMIVRGRKETLAKIRAVFDERDRVFWFHCASLGEFEQGRPLIERLREADGEIKILLTFFSSSGYEIRKDYDLVDCVVYLPADTPRRVKKFVGSVRPERAVFIKYEFWYNYLSFLFKSEIPVYLASGTFREPQPFFHWYGSWFRKALRRFRCLYLQDEASAKLLEGVKIFNYEVVGDTRFDRVVQICESAGELNVIKEFKGDDFLIVVGSSWIHEEEILAEYINKSNNTFRLVIAPHEIHDSNLRRIGELFGNSIRYSEYQSTEESSRVLLIDNIGLLSSIYRYADLAVIGGGFGKGIHNILEAATWGVPVLFGPNHKNFREAIDLVREGGAMTFSGPGEFEKILDQFISDNEVLESFGKVSQKYVVENTGATEKIISDLLT